MDEKKIIKMKVRDILSIITIFIILLFLGGFIITVVLNIMGMVYDAKGPVFTSDNLLKAFIFGIGVGILFFCLVYVSHELILYLTDPKTFVEKEIEIIEVIKDGKK